MAPTTANDVADYLLCAFRERNEPISHLKLQKLLYYMQAWYLAIYNKPLFEDDFEAWVHGPVQPEIYRKFKKFSWEPITEHPGECPKFPDDIKDHIKEVLNVYAKYTAEQLEYIVHRERPWIEARGGLPPLAPGKDVIKLETMRDFYREIGSK